MSDDDDTPLPRPRWTAHPLARSRNGTHAFDEVDPDSPMTGVHPASRDFVRAMNKNGVWKVVYIVGGFAVGCVLFGVAGSRAVAQEAHDAGTAAAAAVKQQADATQRELERFQKEVAGRLDRQDASQTRMEKKLDALVDNAGIRNPAPAPKDGGR